MIRQTWGTNYMDFLYDESGSAYSFIYNGTQYYYVENLQGDVVKILNAFGSVVANYTYDAWGKVTNSGNIVGLYNPIRYRGYYYDTDTGFYYLQSRYYDPTIKRFISADDTNYLGVNGDFTSLNLYAYCGNNPVMGSDPLGKWTISWGGNVSACCFVGVSCS
ncbi:MAG: RHS repeat-associated core domain-containing protein [Ruminococcaceae bacterium]|nr:RHS repeat-associated core domain-containing protein [Oscillospiraceae bacterium]